MSLPRSHELMTCENSALLVVDLQERLVAAEPDRETIVWNVRRLLDGANALGVSAYVSEQYPEKLGSTLSPIAERLKNPRASKMAFSCRECESLLSEWQQHDIQNLLLCGIETHVCILQTALDLLAAGYQVFVAVDAVGARNPIDHQTALRRIEASGGVLTTTEMALFEWCGRAGTQAFKTISSLAKEPPPSHA